jgi:hypothetical protein
MEKQPTYIPVRCSKCHRIVGYTRPIGFIRTNDSVNVRDIGSIQKVDGQNLKTILCPNCQEKKEP